jgi:hypothetical protein
MIGDRNLMSHTFDFAKIEAVLQTVQSTYLLEPTDRVGQVLYERDA